MTTSSENLDKLGRQRYISLTTFRRDGTAVATPVWLVRDGDTLAVWTAADAGKVKRIRRSGEVTVAPCTIRGVPRGEPVPGRAVRQPLSDTVRVLALIRRKYGLLGWLATWKARRRPEAVVSFAITLTEPTG